MLKLDSNSQKKSITVIQQENKFLQMYNNHLL